MSRRLSNPRLCRPPARTLRAWHIRLPHDDHGGKLAILPIVAFIAQLSAEWFPEIRAFHTNVFLLCA